MGLPSVFRNIYDLDTLDTRFTNSTSVPYKAVIEARNDSAQIKDTPNKAQSRAQPSKWNTPEFYFYYLIFILAVPYMFWIPYTVSNPSDPRYPKYEHLLSDGWILGRKIDVSDAQYSFFRSNLPYMGLLLLLHPFARKVWNAVFPLPDIQRKSVVEQGRTRLQQRASFDYAFALLFLVVLHGVSAIKVLTILYVNYQLATTLPRKHVPAATWVFNVCTLFANELCNGYRLKDIAMRITPPLSPHGDAHALPPLVQWGAWLDGFGGLSPRWEVLFNFTILRLISFNLDYHWSFNARGSSPVEKKQLDPANLSERDRIAIPAEAAEFSFRNYVAYTIYAPLYLAGPIVTFNDFIAQSKHRSPTIETSRTILYAIRFLLVLLAMEVVLHFDYVNAMSLASPVWSDYTAAQLALLSYMNLHIIWLKLLLPWRLFRLWALLDGIDPPENMIRCVSNNFSTKSFWKAWHRSYNRWLIRYIYVPLGGSDFSSWRRSLRSVATFLLVFTFVALWHDIRLRLLIWGWLIVLFMMPEVIAGFVFPAHRYTVTQYRMLSCVGAVGNVLMMISANLVGFAVGLDGLQAIIYQILHDWSGVLFLITACAAVFVGIQVMFEIRESELRRGISLKC
ncbi:putative glycerol:H+ symporter [Sodiomyces alkalinus F11]|uniref:Putative glycerol:H+ symporter n=1 Tax=Sodiomyces alkalinus (strain CBS 110278 / VKM F-3762 / F11) TaxID=1314773 RepID=A0A3N2Q6C4_SODAK|nr:putative glycerol:H+ symporter [Sodiomyces alkalinus F11]ROT42257.1 putative glycerol:H+ symporter [Sodiomyces alkalinus F11]